MKNPVTLITYADSLGGSLAELNRALDRHFAGAIGGVHLLPFFPSSGDRGFAPLCYDKVDPAFGDWEDVARLTQGRSAVYDFMINHLSRQSPEFLDFLEKHDASAYRDLFLRYRDFWPDGVPSEWEVEQLYRRKPTMPCVDVTFADGTSEKIWCTFGDQQMDLNVSSPVTKEFIRRSLTGLMDRGASVIRLDAFAFAVKKLGTSCFFVEPEMWELLDECRATAQPRGVELLLEMHDHYTIQQKLAEHGHLVYDFALPLLLLHTLYTGDGSALRHWFDICPKHCHTTLDTHDGMGVPDVEGLLEPQEVRQVIETLLERGANIKWAFREGSLDHTNLLNAYQMNATYYSALGKNDEAYLLARAIQFFAPGTPQVYYVGLLAGKNDAERFAATGLLTDVNRHSYTPEEIDREVRRPIVRRLLALMRFRNTCEAFDGSFEVLPTPADRLQIRRVLGESQAMLDADLKRFSFTVRVTDREGERVLTF